MARTHRVKVRRPYISYYFEAWAYPLHPMSRIPFFGPFFTFNLGRNPRFVVNMKYIGYESTGEGCSFDSVSIPPPEDEALWDLDLGLMIDGEYLEGGDSMQVDLRCTTLRGKTQRYTTRVWPLSWSGKAALQIEYSEEEAIYSFEVKDISAPVVIALTGIFFTIVGSILGVVVSS